MEDRGDPPRPGPSAYSMDDGTERRRADPLEIQVAVMATELRAVAATVATINRKVDNLDAKMQRVEAVVAVVRWLGVGGVVVAVVALLKAFGLEVQAP